MARESQRNLCCLHALNDDMCVFKVVSVNYFSPGNGRNFCMCIHTHTYTHTHTHTHIYIERDIYTCTHTYVCSCKYSFPSTLKNQMKNVKRMPVTLWEKTVENMKTPDIICLIIYDCNPPKKKRKLCQYP